MNMHTAGRMPDWEKVPPVERTPFQRLAARTGGILTPGNFISLTGVLLVGSGLYDICKGNKTKGLVKIGLGRVADVLDGAAANATGTKSPLGEAVDVTLDKAATAATLPIFIKSEILPTSVGVAIGTQNLANTIFSLSLERRGNKIHPSKAGKYATFAQWVTLITYGAASAFEEKGRDRLANTSNFLGTATAVAATAMGTVATIGYAEQAISNRELE